MSVDMKRWIAQNRAALDAAALDREMYGSSLLLIDKDGKARRVAPEDFILPGVGVPPTADKEG